MTEFSRPTVLHILNSDIRGGAEEQAALFMNSSASIFNHKILLLKNKKHSNLFDDFFVCRGFLNCIIFLFKCKNIKFIHSWLPLSELFILLVRNIFSNLNSIVLLNSYHGPFPFKLKIYSLHLRLIIYFNYFLAKKLNNYNRIFVSVFQKNQYSLNIGPIDSDASYVISPTIPLRSTKIKYEAVKFPNDFFVVGMMARFDKFKNHKLLFEVVNHLKSLSSKRVILLMAGYGISSNNIDLLKILSSCNLEEDTLLLDQVDNKELFFNIIDTHVLLSHCESFGLVTVESLVRNIPALMNNTGVANELINNNLFRICELHDNPLVIANKLFELLTIAKSGSNNNILSPDCLFDFEKFTNFPVNDFSSIYFKNILD
jgi:glycosyltransferase involved in cell wall biosynthesis